MSEQKWITCSRCGKKVLSGSFHPLVCPASLASLRLYHGDE